MELTCGPHLAVTEGEGVISGLRHVKKETHFGQYATAAQARMVGLTWAEPRPVRKEQAGWAESKERK
jgi:hypothetical protein